MSTRSVAKGYPIEAHKEAYVIHYMHGGKGQGGKRAIWRLLKIKYDITNEKTIGDWSGARITCSCGYHNWPVLDKAIKDGEFPAPTQDDFKQAMLGAGGDYAENLDYALAVDNLAKNFVGLLEEDIARIRNGEIALTSQHINAFRELKEWSSHRQLILPKEIEGAIEAQDTPALADKEPEAVAVGAVMPAIEVEGE